MTVCQLDRLTTKWNVQGQELVTSRWIVGQRASWTPLNVSDYCQTIFCSPKPMVRPYCLRQHWDILLNREKLSQCLTRVFIPTVHTGVHDPGRYPAFHKRRKVTTNPETSHVTWPACVIHWCNSNTSILSVTIHSLLRCKAHVTRSVLLNLPNVWTL